MHIIKRELRANLKALIIWSVVMAIFVALMVSEYSAYHDNPEMAAILESMPEQLMKAFAIESANLTTPSGFISVAAVYIYLTLGMYAAILGSNILAKEERDKTAEFFLTLPVSREKVITSKLITGIINCIIINIITSLATIVSMMPYDLTSEFYEFLGMMMLAVFIIQLMFLVIGMLMASILRRYKSSGKISTALVLILYVVSILSGLHKNLDFLKYTSPFKYYAPLYILNEMSYESKYLVLSAVVIVLSLIGTYMVYPKRDLHL